jgi:hypothetical protein
MGKLLKPLKKSLSLSIRLTEMLYIAKTAAIIETINKLASSLASVFILDIIALNSPVVGIEFCFTPGNHIQVIEVPLTDGPLQKPSVCSGDNGFEHGYTTFPEPF